VRRPTGLYRACGCGGWIKGHPYEPQPHYLEVTKAVALRMLREAVRPTPRGPAEAPAVFYSEQT